MAINSGRCTAFIVLIFENNQVSYENPLLFIYFTYCTIIENVVQGNKI
jgi:hypothetical protein